MSNSVNIYWSPYVSGETPDWNMLYKDPDNLLKDIKSDINPGLKGDSFLVCPAVTDKFKKTFILRNTLDSKFNFNENQEVFSLSKDDSYIKMKAIRKPTMSGTNDFVYNLQWMFFAEEPLVADFTAPYFHKPKYMNYGAVIPGSMDIGQWFRPYHAEIVTWESDGYIEFKEDEPLAYVQFNTDKDINLIRFNMTPNLKKYSESCRLSPTYYGHALPLIERYKRFRSSRMHQMILKEIKSNLVKED